MICQRPTCGQPIRPCPSLQRMGSCGYFLCGKWVHQDGMHRCQDMEGDATPASVPPVVELPRRRPEGEVA